MSDFFEITVPIGSADEALFILVVNQGIDARLEGFTQSKFTDNGRRVILNFHERELTVLLRRMLELEADEADQWADDIVLVRYGFETI